MILILLAAVSAPLLPPHLARNLHCVAIIANNRDPAHASDGAFFMAIVGADVMDATGLPKEAVRTMILDQVRIVRTVRPRKAEIADCARAMKARVAIERAPTQ